MIGCICLPRPLTGRNASGILHTNPTICSARQCTGLTRPSTAINAATEKEPLFVLELVYAGTVSIGEVQASSHSRVFPVETESEGIPKGRVM
jgi:hypothetical protein